MAHDKLQGDDVRDRIERVALQQLRRGGPEAVSVNAIGKELGVSGPALYRYVRNRADVLTMMIVGAYEDLADALLEASSGRRSDRARLTALVTAYRAWALSQPHRYRLLFRAPLPGYDPNSAQLVAAAQRAMRLLVDGCPSTGGPSRPDVREFLHRHDLPASSAAAARYALALWPRLHGLVSLEIEWIFDSMAVDADPLYRALLD